MFMTLLVMMFGVGVVMIGIVRVALIGVRTFRVFLALIGLGDLRRIDAGVLHHLALDAFAIAAAAGIAMARTATMAAGGAVFALFLGLAMGALVGFDQCLPVSERDLGSIGGAFTAGQE